MKVGVSLISNDFSIVELIHRTQILFHCFLRTTQMISLFLIIFFETILNCIILLITPANPCLSFILSGAECVFLMLLLHTIYLQPKTIKQKYCKTRRALKFQVQILRIHFINTYDLIRTGFR